MSPRIELVVTDLDGSLWWTDDHIPQVTLDAWARIEAAGVPVLVATGRREERARVPLGAFGLVPPAVVLNGGLGLDLHTGERFWRAVYEGPSAGAVLAAFRAEGLDPCVYVDHPEIDVYVSTAPSTHPDHVASFGDRKRVDDLDRVAAEEEVLGFSLLGIDKGPLDVVALTLAAIAQPHCDHSIEYPGRGVLTVAPRGRSKWNGIEAFCRARGLDPAAVLVVGDGPNDLEMLQAAAVAAVPSSASEVALAVGDVVIGRPQDGGWAEIENHLGW